MLGLAGAENLAGKVLLDISNPLDFSAGFPPTLFVKDTDSLGEQIQRAFPEARVVKTLNTLTAALMVDPQLARRELARSSSPATTPRPRRPSSGCWRASATTTSSTSATSSTARGTEMLLPIWLRLMGRWAPGSSTSRSSADPTGQAAARPSSSTPAAPATLGPVRGCRTA